MIQLRSVIGTPQPPASRRKMRGCTFLLAHSTGAQAGETTRYHSADPAKVLDDAKAAASFGIAAGKPWEYNYMLGLSGGVFEQAGEYMGQHCLNFNDHAIGVIWLNAVGIPPTQAQIDSWWWLRDDLVEKGVLIPGHIVTPHYRFRTTGCPNDLAEAPGAAWNSPTGEGRLGELIEPLRVSPTVPEEDDMQRELVIVGNQDFIGPERYLYDGMNLRKLADEADFNEVVEVWGLSAKKHPDPTKALSDPVWKTGTWIAQMLARQVA